jgi:hypothetical protein
MRVALLISLFVGLVFASGATAVALANPTGGEESATLSDEAVPIGQVAPSDLPPIGPALRPAGDQPAAPLAQGGLAIVNGIGIQTQNPTCGVPFTVHVNAANQSGQTSLPGTVSLQNIHRGTGNVNYTGSQGYPSIPVDGNYVVVFQVLVNSYISSGQELIASTNGSTFRLKYDIDRGNCPKTSSSDVPPPPSGTGQFLQVRHSGKCLDVPGGSRNAVTPVQQYSCSGADNQSWSVQGIGNGHYRIVSRYSGMCLDVQGFSQSPQGIVQQYPCNGGDNQSFSFVSTSGGYNMVVAKHSGLCLDVRGATNDDLAPIQQFNCHGNANQQWIIR